MTLPPELAPLQEASRTLLCKTVTESGARHYNHIRGLAPLMVGERFGSSEIADFASPSETLLAALGSCLSARIHANAAAGNIHIARLELHVEADLGASPLWEPAGGKTRSAGFEAIRVTVHIDADASAEAIRALVAHAVLWSPVANTLHDPVHLDVAIDQTS